MDLGQRDGFGLYGVVDEETPTACSATSAGGASLTSASTPDATTA